MSAPWASALSTAGMAVLLIQRFDPDRESSPAAIYAFRLFGIRTILIGLELLGEGTDEQPAAVSVNVISTASD